MTEANKTYLEAFNKLLIDDEWTFDRINGEKEAMFMIPMGISNAPGLLGRVFYEDSGNVKIRTRVLKETPKEKRIDLLKAINELNTIYRFVGFTIDNDGDIHASYDLTCTGEPEEVADTVLSMFRLSVNIINEAFPILAKALWA